MTNKKIYETIIKIVCKYYGINEKELYKSSRKRTYTKPRQLCHFLIKKHTDLSLYAIGKIALQYEKDKAIKHDVIIYSVNKIQDELETNLRYCYEVGEILEQLYQSINIEEYPKITFHKKYKNEIVKDYKSAELLKEIQFLKYKLSKATNYGIINQLLMQKEEDILECIEYKIKPHLRMVKSKVTNQDLINKQYETRTM